MADNGTFVTVNVSAAPQPERAIAVRNEHVEPDRAQLSELLSRLADGRLTSRIATTFPLDEAAEAHRASGRRQLGKVALTV